jgi:hypothetical protein
MVSIFSSEQKLTGGISFTMQFPMATVKKNALYTYVLVYLALLSSSENRESL